MGSKRRWLVLLLATALMLMCGTHALADRMTPAAANRIEVHLPEGLVTKGEPVISNGRVTVQVDDAKTNWTEVLMRAASREWIEASLEITPPAGMTKATRENFGSGDVETLDAIAQGVAPEWFAGYQASEFELNKNGKLDGSVIFAQLMFDKKKTYLRLEDATNAGTVICWENDSGTRQFEYVQWEFKHTDSTAMEVTMPLLPKKYLSAVSSSLPAGVKAEIEMGAVTCAVNDFSSFDELPIVIGAPEGATEAIVCLNDGSINGVSESRIPVVGGKVKLTITAQSHVTFNGHISPAQLDYTIRFVKVDDGAEPMSEEEPEEPEGPDEPGPEETVLDFGLLTVWLLDKEKVPSPYYNRDGAKPVANDRLTIWQGKRQVNNKIIYREKYGNAHLSTAGLSFSEKNGGNIRMEVTAPEWAVAYSFGRTGGDFIYQTNGFVDGGSTKSNIPKNKTVTVYDFPLFITIQAGRALVFQQDGITARYGGYIAAINWYDSVNATTPRLVEYISITHDEFGVKVRNAVKRNENEITRPVTEVTAISQLDCDLVICRNPQSGDSAIQFDLHMEDDHGVTYNLDSDTIFYIPYPEGYSYEDKDVTYTLYHYDDEYDSYVEVTLVATPYGLRFVENHLSPFVLAWNDPSLVTPTPSPSPTPTPTPEPTATPVPPVDDLPKTGDDSHLGWLMGMMAISFVALAYLMRRKSKA